MGDKPLDTEVSKDPPGSEGRILCYQRRLASGLAIFHPDDNNAVFWSEQNKDDRYNRCQTCGRKFAQNGLCGICRAGRKADGYKRKPGLYRRIQRGAPADGTNKFRFGDVYWGPDANPSG